MLRLHGTDSCITKAPQLSYTALLKTSNSSNSAYLATLIFKIKFVQELMEELAFPSILPLVLRDREDV